MDSVQLSEKYGVVKFRGTLHHNSDHLLVFQSDDVVETMTELERLCDTSDINYGYMIVVRKTQSAEDS